jgi:ABC-2 type transport system ATP-binding protein
MDEADLYSDEIAIINRGKMVMSGTADQLKHSLRREVIQFNLIVNIIDKNVLNRIRDLDFVNDLFMNGSELSVVVEDAETALPIVMEILRNEDISVHKICMTRPTLDDVFLKYAGNISLQGGGIGEIKQVRITNGKG